MKTGLADTLIPLLAALDVAPGCGLFITELDLELPLEVSTIVHLGELIFLAQAPHSRWQAGFLPPVQRLRLRIGAAGPAGPDVPREDLSRLAAPDLRRRAEET